MGFFDLFRRKPSAASPDAPAAPAAPSVAPQTPAAAVARTRAPLAVADPQGFAARVEAMMEERIASHEGDATDPDAPPARHAVGMTRARECREVLAEIRTMAVE